jgi:hypothetical protein
MISEFSRRYFRIPQKYPVRIASDLARLELVICLILVQV